MERIRVNSIKDITEFIFTEDELEKADIIFIPGCARPETMEEGARLYLMGFAPFLLPSGKYSITKGHFGGEGDYKTESEYLIEIGVKNGVPREKILIEDQATYTMENAIFSRKVTDEAGLDIKKAIICCKSFHARRACMYYQMAFPETKFLIAAVDIDGITKDNWYRSEAGRKHISGELKRIAVQFEDLVPKE